MLSTGDVEGLNAIISNLDYCETADDELDFLEMLIADANDLIKKLKEGS